jgi:peroxiredoxin
MLQVGDRAPDVRLWLSPSESRTVHELVADRRVLLLFYLFDWSST